MTLEGAEMSAPVDPPSRPHRPLAAILVLSYLLATYLYWPVMKALGVLFFGSFAYRARFSGAPHGYIEFSTLVALSPLTVPIDLLLGLISLPACGLGYVEPAMGGSVWNFVLVVAAFAIPMAAVSLAACWLWRTLAAPRRSGA